MFRRSLRQPPTAQAAEGQYCPLRGTMLNRHRSKQVHQGGWHLPQGKGTNMPFPHGGSNPLLTCTGYRAGIPACPLQCKLGSHPQVAILYTIQPDVRTVPPPHFTGRHVLNSPASKPMNPQVRVDWPVSCTQRIFFFADLS